MMNLNVAEVQIQSQTLNVIYVYFEINNCLETANQIECSFINWLN
jgi:hypothetical protein